jgi:hypothetical protein
VAALTIDWWPLCEPSDMKIRIEDVQDGVARSL